MLIVVMLTLGAVAILVVEALVVRTLRNRIPVRIHVNGTRGKSSVVAYVGAALRAHGRRTLCKVTGIHPTIILPDGTHTILRRWGRPRVQEQIAVLRRAARLRCDALVMECMSIAPLLQKVETSALKPQLTVLTNILDDHREELGVTETEQVEGFCSALPRNGIVLSNERRLAPVIEQSAASVGTQVMYPEEEYHGETPEGILPENMSLALAVCARLGLDPVISREAIEQEARTQVNGSLRSLWEHGGLQFVNGFAVNDIPSAERFMTYWKNRLHAGTHLVMMINSRSDRPLRSVEFSRWCATHREEPDLILIGSHKRWMQRALLRYGVPRHRIRVWSSIQARRAGDELQRCGFPRGTTIVGLGNIAGDGFLVLEGIRSW